MCSLAKPQGGTLPFESSSDRARRGGGAQRLDAAQVLVRGMRAVLRRTADSR